VGWCGEPQRAFSLLQSTTIVMLRVCNPHENRSSRYQAYVIVLDKCICQASPTMLEGSSLTDVTSPHMEMRDIHIGRCAKTAGQMLNM